MLPNPSEVQYFLEVAGTLNISRAAERLGITQPTLSLSIQRLEQSIGTPLLLRGKTGVRLTRAGTRFAAQAQALLDQWAKMRNDARSEETEIKGSVSIGCHPSVALYSVPGFAVQILEAHPDLEISFRHDLSRRITEAVISFELDCGIVVNPVAHPDLRIVPLAGDLVQFWRSTGSYVSDVLIFDPDLVQAQTLIAKGKKLGAEGQFRRTITTSSLEVAAKLAALGAGAAILPTRVAKLEPSNRLKPLFGRGGPVFEDKICLIYRPDAQRSLAFKTVVRAIEASFKET